MSSAGEVIHVNEAAERLLAATPLVRVGRNRLLLPQRYHAEFFERCASLEHAIRAGAASLLADGMPLKSIADTLGVQYDTVRKQLMSNLQRTSTNRQPELVRLLLHLPAAAAPQAGPVLGRTTEGKKLT